MLRILILTLYLFDQIISRHLPVSSGAFAAALLLLQLRYPLKFPQRLINQTFLGFFVLLVAGICGGVLSGTPIGLFFLTTLGLFSMLWLVGGKNPVSLQVITPKTAFYGVLIGTLLLWCSRITGFDIFIKLTGESVNRPTGLFSEPSHLALYLLPLIVIAWERVSNRKWIA
ncbi:hypothetical protein ACVBEH_14130 [Roseateles sp. GG27B]